MNSAIERGQSFLDEIALQPGQIRTPLYVAVTAPLPSPEPLPLVMGLFRAAGATPGRDA